MHVNKKNKKLLKLEKKAKDIEVKINSYFPKTKDGGHQ